MGGKTILAQSSLTLHGDCDKFRCICKDILFLFPCMRVLAFVEKKLGFFKPGPRVERLRKTLVGCVDVKWLSSEIMIWSLSLC